MNTLAPSTPAAIISTRWQKYSISASATQTPHRTQHYRESLVTLRAKGTPRHLLHRERSQQGADAAPADAIGRLPAEPMSERRARRRIGQKFSLASATRQYAELYRDLAD